MHPPIDELPLCDRCNVPSTLLYIDDDADLMVCGECFDAEVLWQAGGEPRGGAGATAGASPPSFTLPPPFG